MSNIVYYSRKMTPLSYEEAVERLKRHPDRARFLKDVPDSFINYLIDNGATKFGYIPALAFLDRKYLAPGSGHIQRIAEKYPFAYITDLPAELRTEELTIVAVKSCKGLKNEAAFGRQHNIFYSKVPREEKTAAVTKAYWDMGGRTIYGMPVEHLTQEMCNEAFAVNAGQFPFIPNEFRTQEMCEQAMAFAPFRFLEYVPEVYRTMEMCRRAIETSGGYAYQQTPKEMRTPDIAMLVLHTLEARHIKGNVTGGIAVGEAVRLTPVSARSDEFMRLALKLFREERKYVRDKESARYMHPDLGKPHSTAFAKYIEKADAEEATLKVAEAPPAEPKESTAERTLKGNSLDDLKFLYRSLYDMNHEAAEEDYLEYFEPSYSPKSIELDSMEWKSQVIHALRSLLKELRDDLGDEATYYDWLAQCGCSKFLEEEILYAKM